MLFNYLTPLFKKGHKKTAQTDFRAVSILKRLIIFRLGGLALEGRSPFSPD